MSSRGFATVCLQLCCRLFEAVDLEADVMDAAPALAALGAGKRVVLEAQHGDIDVVIGEEVAGDALVLELLHHLQPEVLDVEVLGCLFVLGLDRDVPDACHGRRPPGWNLSCLILLQNAATCEPAVGSVEQPGRGCGLRDLADLGHQAGADRNAVAQARLGSFHCGSPATITGCAGSTGVVARSAPGTSPRRPRSRRHPGKWPDRWP